MRQGRLVESVPAETRPFYVNDHGLDSLFSITVASGADVLEAGTLLEKNGSGLYDAYSGGTAAGILMYRVDPTFGDVLASMMIHGVVLSGLLTGFDAGAMADLPLISFN